MWKDRTYDAGNFVLDKLRRMIAITITQQKVLIHGTAHDSKHQMPSCSHSSIPGNCAPKRLRVSIVVVFAA